MIKDYPIVKSAPTWWVRIYISGPIDVARQTIRKYCLQQGLCVTIQPTQFIYTGGEEFGYVVELLNYPRFPVSPNQLNDTAEDLADQLLIDTHQHSVLWMDPTTTKWVSRRPGN